MYYPPSILSAYDLSLATGFGHNYIGNASMLQPGGSARQSLESSMLQPGGSARQSLEELMGCNSLSSNQSDAVNMHFNRDMLYAFGQQALSAAPGSQYAPANLWSHGNWDAGKITQTCWENIQYSTRIYPCDCIRLSSLHEAAG